MFALLILIQAALFAPGVHAATPHIDIATFNRDVDPAGARYLTDAIQTAERDGATALVITIDTPGGDLDSMETIVRAELAATIPIISYVSPEAAQAASAGSFIALAAPVAAMGPNTRIGAASPVDVSGGDLDSMETIVRAELAATIPIISYVSPEAAQAASAGSFIALAAPVAAMGPNTRIGAASPVDVSGGDLGSTLKAKVEQDLEALMRSIQTSYHRNVTAAEAMISNATAYTDSEALSDGIITLQAPSLTDLLTRLANYSGVYSNGDLFTLNLAGLPTQTLQPSLANSVETFLFDPTVLFIVFVIAAICIYLELAHPGAIVPGVVGALALVVFLIGATGISPNWGGLALMLLTIALLAVDTRAPTHGVLTVGALISLVAGALIFFDTGPNPGAQGVNLYVVVGVTLGVGLIALLVLRAIVAAQMRRVTTGAESYIGQIVTVIEPVAPVGRVSLQGENWAAKLASPDSPPLPTGALGRVTGVQGLTLLVTPAPEPAIQNKRSARA